MWEPYSGGFEAYARADRVRRRNHSHWIHELFGIQIVDAVSGGSVTLANALRDELYTTGTRWLVQAISGPALERHQAVLAAAKAEVDRELPADVTDAARQYAVADRMRGRGEAGRACGPIIARMALGFVILPNRRRQTLAQMAGGTMTVRVPRRLD